MPNTLKHPYAVLSTDYTIPHDDKNKDEIRELYKLSKWRETTTTDNLNNIVNSGNLVALRTDNLVVLDFDHDITFNEAMKFNASLNDEHKCKFIVRSTRKGGHFYFSALVKEEIECEETGNIREIEAHVINDGIIRLPDGHTKQPILDILTGAGHNVIAPTEKDNGKKIVINEGLTPYNTSINTFASLVVIQNMPTTTKHIVLNSEGHSDDNNHFIELFLANQVTGKDFNTFYGVPEVIPQGQSNSEYLRVSTRLGSDETVDQTNYLSAMKKFNEFHQRKTDSELKAEITDRMIKNLNGLWRYNEQKAKGGETFSTTHKWYKTKVDVYYDIDTGEYISTYLNKHSQQQLVIKKNKSMYVDLMEKISTTRAADLRKTEKILAVHTINDYSQNQGFDPDNYTFNKAIVNNYLAAFHGTKPPEYEEPTKLLEICKYMWGDEYEYLLDITAHRYKTFAFSPVITYFRGVEGSGKDASVELLSRGFSQDPQKLDPQLVHDKHSNWQTQPNAIFSEIGSWRNMEIDTVLSILKTISGSNGLVTYRGMQQTAVTVKTLIKIWVTSNEWIKLHTDPLTQRRIHVVDMTKTLSKEDGGDFSSEELSNHLFNEEQVLNFYYWLGNVHKTKITTDQYMTPTCRKDSESYQTYIENTQNQADKVSVLLYSQDYSKFEEALKVVGTNVQECIQQEKLFFKYRKDGQLVVTTTPLKTIFARVHNNKLVNKTIDRIHKEKEYGKRLQFANRPNIEAFMVLYDAPQDVLNPEAITDAPDLDLN